MLKKIKGIVISLLAFFSGTIIAYIVELFSGIEKAIVVIVLALIAILIFISGYEYYKKKKYIRYSIIVFVLNSKNELLLVLSPHHHRLIPPGGSMNDYEMPHLAVERMLKTQADLDREDYVFHESFHNKVGRYGRVLDCVAPFATQHEFITAQSKNVRYHYSFIYVCRLKKHVDINTNLSCFPNFYSIEEIKEMEDSVKPFQDIIIRYGEMLQKLN